MKYKNLLSIFSILFVANSGSAHDNSVLRGMKASIDVELPGKWHGNDSAVTLYRPGCGFTISGVSNIYLGKNFYFEPGISLACSQYKYKDVVFSDSHG